MMTTAEANFRNVDRCEKRTCTYRVTAGLMDLAACKKVFDATSNKCKLINIERELEGNLNFR